MHWHWQNLNKRKNGRGEGSGLLHGRAWLHLSHAVFGVTWAFFGHAKHFHAYINMQADYEDQVVISLALPYLFAVWFAVDDLFPLAWLPGHTKSYTHRDGKRHTYRSGECREIGFSIHHGKVWVWLWGKTDEWSNKDPKWQFFVIHVDDILLGEQKHSEEVLGVFRAEIPMPERAYPANVKLTRSMWKRPRWPRPIIRVGATIEPDTPVPIPGKGENDYDFEEDAIYSMAVYAATPEAAVSAFAKSAMEDRERYGGAGWLPKEEARP